MADNDNLLSDPRKVQAWIKILLEQKIIDVQQADRLRNMKTDGALPVLQGYLASADIGTKYIEYEGKCMPLTQMKMLIASGKAGAWIEAQAANLDKAIADAKTAQANADAALQKSADIFARHYMKDGKLMTLEEALAANAFGDLQSDPEVRAMNGTESKALNDYIERFNKNQLTAETLEADRRTKVEQGARSTADRKKAEVEAEAAIVALGVPLAAMGHKDKDAVLRLLKEGKLLDEVAKLSTQFDATTGKALYSNTQLTGWNDFAGKLIDNYIKQETQQLRIVAENQKARAETALGKLDELVGNMATGAMTEGTTGHLATDLTNATLPRALGGGRRPSPLRSAVDNVMESSKQSQAADQALRAAVPTPSGP